MIIFSYLLGKDMSRINSYTIPGGICPHFLIVFTDEGGLMLYINALAWFSGYWETDAIYPELSRANIL